MNDFTTPDKQKNLALLTVFVGAILVFITGNLWGQVIGALICASGWYWRHRIEEQEKLEELKKHLEQHTWNP